MPQAADQQSVISACRLCIWASLWAVRLAPPLLHPQAEAADAKSFPFSVWHAAFISLHNLILRIGSSQYETFDSVSYLRWIQSPVSGFSVTPEGPSQAPRVLVLLCITSTWLSKRKSARKGTTSSRMANNSQPCLLPACSNRNQILLSPLPYPYIPGGFISNFPWTGRRKVFLSHDNEKLNQKYSFCGAMWAQGKLKDSFFMGYRKVQRECDPISRLLDGGPQQKEGIETKKNEEQNSNHPTVSETVVWQPESYLQA